MTRFEELAREIHVGITTNERGIYTGLSAGLAAITTEVILSDDEKVFNMSWDEQKELIKEKFYKTFPYMK